MSWVEYTSGQRWRVRYRRGDGSVASECGFTNQKTAQNRAQEIDVDRRRDAFYDRARGRVTLTTWLPRWWITLDLDDVTLGNYRCLVDRHIGPRFGIRPVGDIIASDVKQWSSELHAAGYEHSTVEGIIGLLSRILADAVEDGLLPANPVHRHHRRGKRAFRIPQEMLWATPEEVLRGAHQAEQLRDRASAILIITTAWTGCRWGEMAALQRHNTHLDDRVIIIDPTIGALKQPRIANGSAHPRHPPAPARSPYSHFCSLNSCPTSGSGVRLCCEDSFRPLPQQREPLAGLSATRGLVGAGTRRAVRGAAARWRSGSTRAGVR